MNLGNVPESKNFQDRTSAPWYDPNRMLANVIISMSRAVGLKKQQQLDNIQAQRDANPLPKQSPQQQQADYNAKVTRDPSGRGWSIQRSGQIDEFAPDVADNPEVIKTILAHAGIK